ncbi:hypothetical protein [Rhodospira trueperi]|uniref:NlpE N-terminal domain-containing protein n=1 Tax=Rhodospira trueperi TaxID=69960 RepID=A0A1G6WYF1_9PROT|nr:hypothetical protein [Rhodospira trueperi]SDD70025.1 hypothetical protein SAMN05421720_101287 [Rhodospira trueperi]
MRPFGALLALSLVCAASAASADPLPSDLHGSYAPNGLCSQSYRMLVDETGATFEYGGHVLTLSDWDVCLTCAGGARYQGIEVWAFPEIELQRKPVLRFNADEHRGVVVIEYAGTEPLPVPLAQFVHDASMLRCD